MYLVRNRENKYFLNNIPLSTVEYKVKDRTRKNEDNLLKYFKKVKFL